MAVGAGELEHGVAVPVEPEPAHAVEDRVDRRLGRAGAIGILDAQQELAAVMAREQPVEQRGARAADMEEAGRRGREAGDDRRACCDACGQPLTPVAIAAQRRGDRDLPQGGSAAAKSALRCRMPGRSARP